MKTKTLFVLIAAVIAVDGCSPTKQERETARRAEAAKRELEKVSEFASRHNAITRWEEPLHKRKHGLWFTIDVSRTLMHTNGQPVLFSAHVADLVEKGGVFTAYFEVWESSSVPPLYLALKCSPEQMAVLAQPEVSIFSRFAVVARVETVTRADSLAKSNSPDEEPSIALHTRSYEIYVTGVCDDLLQLNEDNL